MLRLLAWMKYADERLQFTRGLSSDDEAELWLLNDHLGVDLWIELGLPDERRIKKACSRAQEVALFAYNSQPAFRYAVEYGLPQFSIVSLFIQQQ